MAVGFVARRHDDALDGLRLPAACFENVVRAADVRLEREQRSIEAHPDEGLRAEMEDDRGAAFGDGTLDIGKRFELTLCYADSPDVAATEKLGAAVMIAEQDCDLRARREKRRDDV